MLKSKKIVKNLLILYVAVSFAFLGCGKGNVSTGVKMIDDLIGIKKSDKNIQVMLALWQQSQNQYNGTGTVSADIGPSGGSLIDKSGSYELMVPEGALENSQNIRMTVINSETYDIYAPATPKIILEPHGLQFKKPVTLKLKFGNEHTSRFSRDLASIYYINETSGKIEKVETTQSLDGNYLIAKLNHFSLYSGLYLRIEDVVNDIITNPLDIQNIVLEFRAYLNGIGSIARRNYFYSFYQPTLLPFLIRANKVYPPGNNPLLNTFPNDDFDSDGIINSSDTYPFDPTNNGDETPPIVVSVVPNGSNIPTSPGTITVTFNERVSPPTLQYAVRLFDGEREYYVNFESLDITGTVATFRYNYNLESAKNYTIRIEGVTDIFGNRMYGIQNIANFTTVDTGQPKIVAMSPSGWDIPLSTNQITLTFNEAIDPSTLNGFSLKGYGNPTLTFQSISANQKTATFSIDSSLVDSGFYFLNIPSTVKDLAGNNIEIPPYFWMFQVEDNTAPSVYKVEPKGNAVNPDNPGQIVLYFTEPVNITSVQNAVELIGGNQTPPSVTFDRTEQYGTIAYFNINGSLEQKTKYTIRIKAGISDLKGNVSSVPIDFNFQSGDTIPPIVLNVSPPNGATKVNFKNDLYIKVYFDEAMDPYSLNNALLISDDSGLVPYEYREYNVVHLPNQSISYEATYLIRKEYLKEYTTYNLSITSMAKDVFGNQIIPNQIGTFLTASSTGPYITNYSVIQEPTGIKVQLTYNHKVKSNTAYGNRLFLKQYYNYKDYEPSNCATIGPVPNPARIACIAYYCPHNPLWCAGCFIYHPERVDGCIPGDIPVTKIGTTGWIKSFKLNYIGSENNETILNFYTNSLAFCSKDKDKLPGINKIELNYSYNECKEWEKVRRSRCVLWSCDYWYEYKCREMVNDNGYLNAVRDYNDDPEIFPPIWSGGFTNLTDNCVRPPEDKD
jgi:methionine-rich copper-binding protein CopC